MYPPNLSGQYLLQQAEKEQQQINAELLNLQIKVLQNQLQQAKLQQEMIKTQSQTVRFQPQVPTQLVTSSVSITTSSCLSSAFSPPTPAILVAANQPP
jgi:predicted  nucleic acid-binding Zn-ribbon protein